jgi:hypothetical protein
MLLFDFLLKYLNTAGSGMIFALRRYDNCHGKNGSSIPSCTMISIDDFFGRYASTMNNALFGAENNASAMAEFYAGFVVSAHPAGISGNRNDAQFMQSLEQNMDFYRKTGIISMNIASKEVLPLNDSCVMARVNWRSFYENGSSSGELSYEVVYLLRMELDGPKIFAYVTDDEEEELKKHNLILQ